MIHGLIVSFTHNRLKKSGFFRQKTVVLSVSPFAVHRNAGEVGFQEDGDDADEGGDSETSDEEVQEPAPLPDLGRGATRQQRGRGRARARGGRRGRQGFRRNAREATGVNDLIVIYHEHNSTSFFTNNGFDGGFARRRLTGPIPSLSYDDFFTSLIQARGIDGLFEGNHDHLAMPTALEIYLNFLREKLGLGGEVSWDS